MVSAFVSGSREPGLSSGWGHCVMSLGKTRKTRKFRVPVAKTKRFAESFIMKGAQLA